jgi:hypothetical protein
MWGDPSVPICTKNMCSTAAGAPVKQPPEAEEKVSPNTLNEAALHTAETLLYFNPPHHPQESL